MDLTFGFRVLNLRLLKLIFPGLGLPTKAHHGAGLWPGASYHVSRLGHALAQL